MRWRRVAIVRLDNVGIEAAQVLDVRVTMTASACGRFEAVLEVPEDVPAGGSFDLPVTFRPSPGAPSGCDCVAAGALRIETEADPLEFEIPLLAVGACDAPLACAPSRPSFRTTYVGLPRDLKVACHATGEDGVDVSAASVSSDEVEIRRTTPVLPARLGPGEAVAIDLRWTPPVEETLDGVLTIAVGAGSLSVPLEGISSFRIVPCSEGFPEAGEPVLEADNWVVTLETSLQSTYTGAVRSLWTYDEQPPLIGDFLVGCGAFAEPECTCGQTGHHYWCTTMCGTGPDDLIINVHALPASPQIDGVLRRLEVGDAVSVRGWEVLRISYPAENRWWSDAGCHTMIVDWVCADEG